MMIAANRIGKTESAAAETAIHATGDYPDWWTGRRFDHGDVLIWACAITNTDLRDVVQKALLGGVGELLGTGYIPKAKIIGKPGMRQAGVSDVIDSARVRRKDGSIATIIFKSYEMQWRKFQGAAPHVIWLDEEPDDYRIYTECMTRILSTKGTLYVTFTPLLGETDLVRHFMSDDAAPGTWVVTATWDDAPHLDKQMKEELKAGFPDHEVEARTAGVPMMGSGRVFPFKEEDIVVPPFQIPPHWVFIEGIDFGIDHPFAWARVAWDRDDDVLYVVDCFRVENQGSDQHCLAIKKRGGWAPVAWPHDGLNREKGKGLELQSFYRGEGLKMLQKSARYDKHVGGAQPREPIVMELYNRMEEGRFKVFSNCTYWLEEFRNYHRKDGKLVDKREDVLKASFYAIMMRRSARPRTASRQKRRAVVSCVKV